MTRIVFGLSLYCTLLLLLGCKPAANHADIIIVNANIISMDRANGHYQAIAFQQDKILALGNEQQIKEYQHSNTQVIDLQGKTLMPAFVAAHEHPAISAVFKKFVDLSGFTHQTNQAVWQALKKAVANTPKGEWVYAMGLDPLLAKDLQLPTKQFLDAIAPDNPVLLVAQSMHSFWSNSQGFNALNIDSNTPNPGHGSFYEKNQAGELTGFISESAAAAPFLQAVKSPLKVLDNYQAVLLDLRKSGFTSVASLGYNLPPLAAKWAADYWASYYWSTPIMRQFLYMKQDEFKYLPDSPNNGDDFFKVLGVKLWHDGSPYTGTMYLNQPYLNNPMTESLGIAKQHRGASRIDAKQFEQQLERFHQQGWQIAVHSQGDASNKQVLASFEKVISQPHDQRHRIEHGLLLPTEQLQKMQQLGLTASFHINHILYYGNALNHLFLGQSRTAKLMPINDAVNAGIRPSLHADSPMFPADPFSLMRTAIQRTSQTDLTINANQGVSKTQALRMMTIDAAWQLHMDDKLGSLEAGKLADFIVLSADPYQLDVEHWTDIVVEQVWMAGSRVELNEHLAPSAKKKIR